MYAAPPPMHSAHGPTSSVELSISAKDLKDRDIISKSDPFAILSVQEPSSGKWRQLGHTEVLKDDLNPSWSKLFLVEYYFEIHQQLQVEVYDHDGSSKDLSSHDFLGRTQFSLGQLLGSPGQSSSYHLAGKNKNSTRRGVVLVKAEEAKNCGQNTELCFAAKNLVNMDGLFNKSDPFLVISKQRVQEANGWTQVFRTKTIDNDLNPKWKPIQMPLQQLCNGDVNRRLLIQVFDDDRGGKSELMGYVETTLDDLLSNRSGGQFQLRNEELQKKKTSKKYRDLGLLTVKARTFRVPTFVEFLRGGLEMNLVIGIDYTASNGNPADPRSLHFIDPRGPNQYQQAVSTTATILQDYDHDKMIPVYGFGGIPPNAGAVNHCFPLNLNASNPEVHGAQGVLQLYTSSLGHIQLHGPTHFAPLIRQTMQIAAYSNDPRKQKYFVLLIITDGAIMDMGETLETIVEASHTTPLSIVIIGVGPADFSSMNALDGDGKKLKSPSGRKAARDIVQFVPFNRFAGNYEALARETLAEIPYQLCEFMKTRNIMPNPSIEPTYQMMNEPSAAQAMPPPAPAMTQPAYQQQTQPQGYSNYPQQPVQGFPQHAAAPWQYQQAGQGYSPGYQQQGYPPNYAQQATQGYSAGQQAYGQGYPPAGQGHQGY